MANISNYDMDYVNSEDARWQREEEQRRQFEKRFLDLYNIPSEEVYGNLPATPQKPLQPFVLKYIEDLKSHKHIAGNEKL